MIFVALYNIEKSDLINHTILHINDISIRNTGMKKYH